MCIHIYIDIYYISQIILYTYIEITIYEQVYMNILYVFIYIDIDMYLLISRSISISISISICVYTYISVYIYNKTYLAVARCKSGGL